MTQNPAMNPVLSTKPATGAASELQSLLREPNSVRETGIDFGVLLDLCLKTVYHAGRPSARLICSRMGLSFGVVEELLQFLRKQEFVEIVGSSGIAEPDYHYGLTSKGLEKTHEALSVSQYVGAAPVPFDTYLEVTRVQSTRHAEVPRSSFEQALSHLVLSPGTTEQIGTAVGSGTSIFLYGEPGNGKSTIAESVGQMLTDPIYVPYAFEVYGHIVRVFDPRVHIAVEPVLEQLSEAEAESAFDLGREFHDGRWVLSRRPLIVTGGELTLADLDLRYSAATKFYVAPHQVKANGGVLVIDDFGRQLLRPEELLNRWMIPMERRVDHLTFHTGETAEIPFDVLLIFATNLTPSRLGDEAFFRRIRHKIKIGDPDEKDFREILRRACNLASIPYADEGADYLIDAYYRSQDRPFRGVHPRDLVNLMTDIGRFRKEQVSFSPDWIDAACRSYFIED